MTKSEMLTFLNGRAMLVIAIVDGMQVVLWEPALDFSIEDAIMRFIEEHDIDWRKEVHID